MMEFQRYPADVVFPGCMMSDMRRFQIERGDFGKVDDVEAKVSELVDHLRTPGGVRFERPSASGHYIEVSYKPLDNGTIISIHRNITELKEREASLAAAKEAAEAARADAERTRQVDADRARQHERGRSAVRQGFQHRVRQPQALRLPRYPPEIGGPGASGFDGIRYMAKRGDYGPDVDVEKIVAERAARIRDPNGSRHVRRTGNGSLVEFTFNPLARRPRARGRPRRHRGQAPRGGAAGGGRHPQADQPRPRSICRRCSTRWSKSASRLCEADGANIFQRDGDTLPRDGEPRLFAAS